MKLAAIVIVLTLYGCHGPLDLRCTQERYFCLDEKSKVSYLETVSDKHLVHIAKIEFATSKPPSGFYILNEVQRRGRERSRAIMYYYASSEVDEYLLDAMTRALTPSKDVCQSWITNAPRGAQPRLKESCNRVYGSANVTALQRSAEQIQKLAR